jgi:type III secretion protein J
MTTSGRLASCCPSAKARIAPGRSRSARCAILAALATLTLAGCKTDLYTKLSEREANEMIALLLGHGIDSSRVVAKDGTSIVRIDEKHLAHAIDLLKASGFPRQTFTNMGEVFKGSGLIASPTEERARFVYALSEELSRTISDIDGVLSARIHVVLPKNDLLRQDTTPSSASVFIRHDVRAPLKNLLPQIKMLVANSIEGLSYDKVSVVLVPVDRAATAENAAATGAEPAATGSARTSGRTLMADLGDGVLAIAAALAMAVAAGAGVAHWFGRRRSAAQAAMAPPAGRNPEANLLASPVTELQSAAGREGASPPARRAS